MDNERIEERIVNNIRALALDMIKEAGNGHPGVVMSAAPLIYTLYAHHLNFDVKNPEYFNRDRFVLSCGHASALLYATLYMAGYDISLDDLKGFRKINSKMPGHPEIDVTPGVEMTTGPLGEGFASAVGIAMGEAKAAQELNDENNKIIDHYTYVLVSDGDLMEGVSYEAASLAGTLKLNKLIVLYDKNNVTLDHTTDITFDEDIRKRFEACNWNVIEVNDGDNVDKINNAIKEAKNSSKPSIIIVDTIIVKYSKYQGQNEAHGMKLDKEEITSIKEKLEVRDIPFTVSTEAIDYFRNLINNRCHHISEYYQEILDNIDSDKRKYLDYLMNKNKNIDISNFGGGINEKESPRDTSSKILNEMVKKHPYVIGGSADLFASTKTYINDGDDFSSKNYSGKNIFFGVREHAMGAIANGLAIYGYRPYISTFLAFSDYLRPSIRLAAIMNLPVVYIFSHDSISIGEDGPTHQPVEQLESLRIIPNLEVFRPADANEVIGSYKTIYEKPTGPAVIALSKNPLNVFETVNINNISDGGSIVKEYEREMDGILISSGEDVHLAIAVANNLKIKGIDLRVVSIPCINRFTKMDMKKYDEILPVEKKKIVISTEVEDAWHKIIYNKEYLITLDQFGLSGSQNDIYKNFGYDIDTLTAKVEELLK